MSTAVPPTMRLLLVGRGEPVLRMEKRLWCAARARGVMLTLSIRTDIENCDVDDTDTPLLLGPGGDVLYRGLATTETLESLLAGIHD